jgi:glycosyltransferase involved in cell wall biosynthesis
MTPPHILCTVTNDLTYDQRMQRICRSLVRAGYRVTLVGRERKGSRPLADEPFRQVRLPCFFDAGKLFYLEYNLRLLTLLFSHPFDIVCAVDLDTILPAFLVSRLLGKPCVLDAHEYFTEAPEIIRRPLIKRIWETAAQAIIPHLKYAYTVGPALARLFEQRYGTPFRVIRNFPERKPLFTEMDRPTKPVILYQGALNEGRGLQYAIQAMQSIDEAELWLAGEGDLSQELRQLARRMNMPQKVRFLGLVRPRELAKLTSRAYIGLNLLENKSLSYYYSMANKAFDYIQAGVPSIQMDFPEYRRINEQYEVFVLLSQLDTERLARLIQLLLDEKGIYQKLRNNCLIAREIYTWENEEKVLVDFYQRIKMPEST